VNSFEKKSFFFWKSFILANAWTITTTNTGRSIINGSFSGELDISGQDNTEIVNRVDQLEKEVKGRDMQIKELNDKVDFVFV